MAYEKFGPPSASVEPEQWLHPRNERRRLKQFLSARRTIGEISLDLQPLIISFRKEANSKRGWSYELDTDSICIGHADALYQLSIDAAVLDVEKLIDAIHGARALNRSLIELDIEAIEIDPEKIPANRQMLVSQVPTIMLSAGPLFSDSSFRHRSGAGGSEDAQTWRLVPYLLKDETLLYAALFLRASFHEFIFSGDGIEDAILENDGPNFIHDAVRAENAIHNAYKAVEAIWGGTLPAKVNKLEGGLSTRGIDPGLLVGYAHHEIHPKERIVDKLIDLRKARDQRAAHGRIHAERKSTYYEILDYQALAATILNLYMKHKFPELSL